jgi:hypothetical protein
LNTLLVWSSILLLKIGWEKPLYFSFNSFLVLSKPWWLGLDQKKRSQIVSQSWEMFKKVVNDWLFEWVFIGLLRLNKLNVLKKSVVFTRRSRLQVCYVSISKGLVGFTQVGKLNVYLRILVLFILDYPLTTQLPLALVLHFPWVRRWSAALRVRIWRLGCQLWGHLASAFPLIAVVKFGTVSIGRIWGIISFVLEPQLWDFKVGSWKYR